MINKEIYLKEIVHSLSLLKEKVSFLNSINLFDINIIAEDFFPGLLNLIYDYELKNINAIAKNAPAIDLFDKKNKIAIQVTSDSDSGKIRHTIEEFIDNMLYNEYDRLIVLILTKKKRYSTSFDTKGKFSFDYKKDIWDTEDLLKDIRSLDTDRVKQISEYLSKELNRKCYILRETQAREVETITDLIEYISEHKEMRKPCETKIDPKYKIYNRFKDFADRLVNEYTSLWAIYGESVQIINATLGIDEAQDIIIMFYLQDISMRFLEEEQDDPVRALNKLVEYFESKLSTNGKKYDRAAIKFYLINEMIKCNVFPNERSEYDGNK